MKLVRQRPTDQPGSGARADHVVLGRFGAPHGIRGEIRLKSYTETPMAVADYGPLEATDGRKFRLTRARRASGDSSDMLIVSVDGVADRNAAEALKGIELSVPRSRLPDTQADDFYHADLIGLDVEAPSGEALGKIIAVHNHGAGDLLEIADPHGSRTLVPFTKAIVPTVDISGGRLIVDPPAGLLDRGSAEEQPP